jgi:flavin-dependent dehydrogenase
VSFSPDLEQAVTAPFSGCPEGALPSPDLLIIGAGPAGSLAALEAARRGASVLLVDKSPFPRTKVCGCCLSSAALQQLAAAGLADLPTRLRAKPLAALRLHAGPRSAEVPIPGGVALSRAAFDSALVKAAVAAGATFLPNTFAVIQSPGVVTLRNETGETTVTARVVIAADGLAGRAAGPAPQASADSRMGAGLVVDHPLCDYAPGAIHMAVGPAGYVGLVRLEDSRLDVAAAFDPDDLRALGGPGPAAAAILAACHLPPIPALAANRWHGTPLLTRARPAVAAERLLVVGDAAAYVEPFTGEGMTWALASGRAAGTLAAEAARSPTWNPQTESCWAALHAALLSRRALRCRALALLLRRPLLTCLAVAALSLCPELALPLVSAIHSPIPTAK